MSEQKTRIIKAIGTVLDSMTESQESYLMGFLECAAAMANNQRTAAPPAAQQTRGGA